MSCATPWRVDPDDPRAPTVEVWEQLTPEQRREVVDSLPSDFPLDEASPPEGDPHWHPVTRARTTLDRWFRRAGRRVYVSGNLAVYYPGERVFSPDVIAVVDVEVHERDRWVVLDEGKGLDFALEVIVRGKRRKDLQRNVEWFARLGIPEYFVYDRKRGSLRGFRLPSSAAKVYEPLIPQRGHYASRVLGLDLVVEDGRLRFYAGDAAIPDTDELIDKLGALVDAAEQRAQELELRLDEEARAREEEARAREEEARAREEEARAREEAEHRLAEALAELERLRRERGGA
ncbi:Uma2 family endonuclease [Sorangium sp. So ce834]|uniref:Uma2 family endonuclease n=1 Tax=Sorangium sp. So ce834 TaxID=3133321 RepID=UPI003F644D2C